MAWQQFAICNSAGEDFHSMEIALLYSVSTSSYVKGTEVAKNLTTLPLQTQ